MSEQSLELLQRIRTRLERTARRITLAELLFGVALAVGVLSGLWALLVAVEAGFWLDVVPRTILFWAIFAVFSGIFGFFLLMPLMRLWGILRAPAPQHVAMRVGDRFPQIGDRLINLLDLSEGRRSDAPVDLVDGAVRMLGREIEPVAFEDVEDFSRVRRAARVASVPLLSMMIFLLAAPGTFVDASRRLLSPGEFFDAPAPFQLVVEPGNVELARGDEIEIRVHAEGEQIPRSVTLAVSNVDEEHVENVRLTRDSSGVFSHRVKGLRKSFRYRAEALPVVTRWYSANVTEHPLVRNLQVTLSFPSYSGIPPQRLDPNVGDVTGLPGTKVSLDMEIGGPELHNASLHFDDGSVHALEVDGNEASGSFTLSRAGSYQVLLESRGGIQNRDPITYRLNLISDAAPAIVLLYPEPDAVLTDDLRTGVGARVTDDFGFKDLRLHFRLAESRFGQTSDTFSSFDLPSLNPFQLDQEIRFDWRIPAATGLDPVPGDVIEYYLEVRDNDTFAGFKAAQSAIHRLRLPSLAEKYEQLEKQQDQMQSNMEDVLRQAENVGEQFKELRDQLRREQDADWEDKRQLEQLQQHQQQLEERVNDLAEQMRSMNENIQENNLLSPETLQMYQEMQKVVEEINSPELMEALRELQQAIQDLNLQQMQQSLENFQFNEQQYKDRLERTLDLFKNLRAQQSLEEAARRAEELAKQQERLAEETQKLMDEGTKDEGTKDEGTKDEGTEDEGKKNEGTKDEGAKGEDKGKDQKDGTPDQKQDPSTENREPSTDNNPEQLAREQELSSEEMKQLEEKLREVQKQISEMKRGPAEKMQKLNQDVQKQQLPQQMQQNAEQLRDQQLQDAQSGQQQMQQQLQQLQSQLSQMRQSMQGAQMQVNMAGLRRALSDILTLSQQQEALRTGLQNNLSQAPSLREDTRRQVELSEGLSTVIDSLQHLAKNIPQMSREVQRQAGEAFREMGQATESMTERAAGQAAGHQKASMMHLNELALLLSDVMNQLMNMSAGGSGSSMQQMLQQMQQMSQQQQQLNQQIQQFLNDMQGSRLSQDMQQRLRQMSAQQEAIKRQLEQLRRNPESRGQLLGDLQKIAEQMEETIRELERRQVDQKMVERQRQILQRLLDAQKSMHQRGEENKREAREGRDVGRESPDALPPQEAAERLRRDLIRALESGYAPDYEELIKRYFELLQKQTLEQE